MIWVGAAFWTLVTLILIKVLNKFSNGRCYSDKVMSGKVAIVTGASGGMGYETALELARRGAEVILACRDDRRGQKAARRIQRITKNEHVRYINLDLSSLSSVRRFVQEFEKLGTNLDVLVNNAGAAGTGSEKTEDGLVKDMQVNYFGTFLLTVLLVPLLKKSAPSRVVNVSSSLHKFGTTNGLNEANRYNYLKSYCNSKLCTILFSNELARRLEDSGVSVNSLHPGQVNTSFYKPTFIEKLRSLVLYSFFKTPTEGAQTSIYLAVSDDCDSITGKYFVDCAEGNMSKRAQDKDLAAELWAESEKLVGLRPEEIILYPDNSDPIES